MPITLLTRPTMPSAGSYELEGGYSIDVFNAAKDLYRGVNKCSMMDLPFPFPCDYYEKSVPEELVKFVEDIAARYPETLLSGTPIRIDSVKVRHLWRKIPKREGYTVLELGTMQEATHEEYAKAAEFSADFFREKDVDGVSSAHSDGLCAEVYHMENQFLEKAGCYDPQNELDRDSALGKGLRAVASLVGRIVRPLFPHRQPRYYQPVEMRVVKGKYKGEEYEGATVFVMLDESASNMNYDWKKLEDRIMERVHGDAKLRDMKDAAVWLEFGTDIMTDMADITDLDDAMATGGAIMEEWERRRSVLSRGGGSW